MEQVLEVINEQMQILGIQYFDMINTSAKVTYPYVTGELTQSGYSYEDGSNTADLLLEAWTRNEFSCAKKSKNILKISQQKKTV